MEGQPEGMKEYIEQVIKHAEAAKAEQFDIGGTLLKTFKKLGEGLKRLVSGRGVDRKIQRRESKLVTPAVLTCAVIRKGDLCELLFEPIG